MANAVEISRRVICLATLLAALPAKTQMIAVNSPAYRSDVSGDTVIRFNAPGYRSPLIAKSWLPGGNYGSDATVATVSIDSNGTGSFVFHAADYPHGPIMVRMSGTRISDGYADTCYLQLYNVGGISWNEGIPSLPPPAASGMSVVFQDDFNGPLSISRTGKGAKYAAHKPDGKDFSQIPFSDPTASGPFLQRDTYLIIRANALLRSTGLISSVDTTGHGFAVNAPYYMECRFIAPDAIGTWPAWWTMTDEYQDGRWGDKTDEIDTIEAYGGDGSRNPNAPTTYMITPHTWGYHFGNDKSNPVDMRRYGGGAGWSYTPHTYGLLVTSTSFVFYLDNLEVMRLPSYPLAIKDPSYFMVNLAVGGSGWPVDLSRYQNIVDMYVDYIRVYH